MRRWVASLLALSTRPEGAAQAPPSYRRPQPVPRRILTGHTGAVMSVAFAPDGRTIASASNDGLVRLSDLS
ncbi:WD40 repeat domain-containing protein [Frankia sp. Cas4]|uniref:WD40 repeat domain-containing protein n=1 Tax=Frankia sp. Cas4 TaxID=3073927 RepID=UPI002AD59FAC|nr:WD40 repeat domain-containing protein [Frankia sp. Cas4]